MISKWLLTDGGKSTPGRGAHKSPGRKDQKPMGDVDKFREMLASGVRYVDARKACGVTSYTAAKIRKELFGE